MSESIDELGTELQKQEDNTLTANRFRELMDTLDVDEGAQELALAILKEEGLHAVQVKKHSGMNSKATRGQGEGAGHIARVCDPFGFAVVHKIARPTPSQLSKLRRNLRRAPRSLAGALEVRPIMGLELLLQA